MTLRQLFYRLLSESLIPNRDAAYKRVSALTAEGRRAGTFPALVDHTREIRMTSWWEDPAEAIASLADQYRVDRTSGQEWSIYLGAEKATMQSLLEAWFGELGLPVLLLRGYGSQTYLDDIVAHVRAARERPAALIYAGDLDPSGEDIERDFLERTAEAEWDQVARVAVLAEHLDRLQLVKQPGKPQDPRAPAFRAKYGELFQVEVEAIEPDTLREIYQAEIDVRWDKSQFDWQLQQEREDRTAILDLASTL